jgi:LPS-assembly lipoprotein
MWSFSMANKQTTGVRYRPQHSLYAYMSAVLLLAGMVALAAGCGFHLRGSAALPPAMAVTYIKSSQPFSTLVDDFSAALKIHDVRVTEERSEATAILNILDSTVETRVLSVNTAGKVLEYDILQTIRFSVVTATNETLVPEQTVSLSRDYVFNTTGVLGSQREGKVVRANLQSNVVNLAMLRITAAAGN